MSGGHEDEMEGLGPFIVQAAEIVAAAMREQAAATRDLAEAVRAHGETTWDQGLLAVAGGVTVLLALVAGVAKVVFWWRGHGDRKREREKAQAERKAEEEEKQEAARAVEEREAARVEEE